MDLEPNLKAEHGQLQLEIEEEEEEEEVEICNFFFKKKFERKEKEGVVYLYSLQRERGGDGVRLAVEEEY